MSSLADSITPSIGPALAAPDPPTRDEADEAWDLDCVELRGIEALSVSQLKKSLAAWMRKTDETETELTRTKTAWHRTQDRHHEEIHELRRALSASHRAVHALSRDQMQSEMRAELEKELGIAPTPKPVKLIDAVGRQFLLPYEKCKLWKDMRRLINRSFDHIDGLNNLVYQERYDLLGPTNEIIMPEYWELAIRPGIEIHMMIWPSAERSRSPSPRRPYNGSIIELPPPPPRSDSASSTSRSIINLDDILQGHRRASPEPEPGEPITTLSAFLGYGSHGHSHSNEDSDSADEVDTYDMVEYEDVLPANRASLARGKSKKLRRKRSRYSSPIRFS